jgi:hypothetical protein
MKPRQPPRRLAKPIRLIRFACSQGVAISERLDSDLREAAVRGANSGLGDTRPGEDEEKGLVK